MNKGTDREQKKKAVEDFLDRAIELRKLMQENSKFSEDTEVIDTPNINNVQLYDITECADILGADVRREAFGRKKDKLLFIYRGHEFFSITGKAKAANEKS